MRDDRRRLFDDWPDRYDRWFGTPIGSLVREYESEVILSLLSPVKGELILDAGCGSGIFTMEVLASGARVVGADVSLPMIRRAGERTAGTPFAGVAGDILSLPFADRVFDKTLSVTALEFIEDERAALREMSRVTKEGGTIVVATLNSMSSWAERRKGAAEKDVTSIFRTARFRSPEELESAFPQKATVRTAVHFSKDDDPAEARKTEEEGRAAGLRTGAFLAARWNNV